MHLIELYLPMNSHDGTPFPSQVFTDIEDQLTEKFGGVTAHKRAPAHGKWQSGGSTDTDSIAIFEVIAETFERSWWKEFQSHLEQQLEQEKLLITAKNIEVL